MDILRTIGSTIWGSSYIWLVVYLFSLFYIWFYRKENQRAFRIFGWYTVIMLVLVVNPWTRQMFSSLVTQGSTEYARLSWTLIWPVCVGYVFCDIFIKAKGILKKSVVLMVLAILLYCNLYTDYMGERFGLLARFTPAENVYKISQDALDANDIMEAHAADDERHRVSVLLYSDEEPEDSSFRVYYGLRQYNYKWLMAQNKGYKNLAEYIPSYGYFIIWKAEKSEELELYPYEMPETLGDFYIGETENYRIYYMGDEPIEE